MKDYTRNKHENKNTTKCNMNQTFNSVSAAFFNAGGEEPQLQRLVLLWLSGTNPHLARSPPAPALTVQRGGFGASKGQPMKAALWVIKGI